MNCPERRSHRLKTLLFALLVGLLWVLDLPIELRMEDRHTRSQDRDTH